MNVVACTRVKNGERYIGRWLDDAHELCTSICVLDDGSVDATVQILRDRARKQSNIFLHLQKNLPRDGGRDCNVLYGMAGLLKADWIFAPDVDEFIDPEDKSLFPDLISLPPESDDILAWTFPFFYFWNDEKHFRVEGEYRDHHVIRLFKYDEALRPPKRATHCQMCPDELDRRKVRNAPVRMVHYGYMDPEDRKAKYEFYTNRDKDPIKAGGGVKDYSHILGQSALILPYSGRYEWLEAQRAFRSPEAVLGPYFED